MNEYYNRLVRLKPVIEADREVLRRIEDAFGFGYNFGDPSRDLLDLGSGSIHDVIGLGKTVTDPGTGYEVHLAIKLNKRLPYSARRTRAIAEQAGMYDFAFQKGLNPPYFVGIVTTEANVAGRVRRFAGIITEDISKGKTLKLIEEPDDEFCIRVLADGSKERIFLDPAFGAGSSNGRLYTNDEARIDI